MTGQGRAPGGDMVGSTLALLVVLIAFALLLVTVVGDTEMAAEEQATEELGKLELAAAEAAADARSVAQIYFGVDHRGGTMPEPSISDDITEISNSLELFKGAIRSAEAQRALADRTLPDVWTELVEAERKTEELQQSLGAVEGALEGLDGDTDTATAVVGLVERNRELRIRNLQLIGQLANLERRVEGIGKPPCWVSPDGRPEYTYKITITDLDFVVEPIWRQDRAGEIEEIGAPVARETVSYDDEDFSRAMYPFLAYGAESDPECRFFVQVVDDTGPYKDAWQARLAILEGYFYKYWLK